MKCQTHNQRPRRGNAQNQHKPAACESEPCLVPLCRGSRHVQPQCVSHKETSLESQRVWRIRRGFGRATAVKLTKSPWVSHLYCAETFLQVRTRWSASRSTLPPSPTGWRKQRHMTVFFSIWIIWRFLLVLFWQNYKWKQQSHSERKSSRLRSIRRGVLGWIPTQQAEPRILLPFNSLQKSCLCIIVMLHSLPVVLNSPGYIYSLKTGKIIIFFVIGIQRLQTSTKNCFSFSTSVMRHTEAPEITSGMMWEKNSNFTQLV